eukprot:6582891-Pyramimonas_sp.AAC.1
MPVVLHAYPTSYETSAYGHRLAVMPKVLSHCLYSHELPFSPPSPLPCLALSSTACLFLPPLIS